MKNLTNKIYIFLNKNMFPSGFWNSYTNSINPIKDNQPWNACDKAFNVKIKLKLKDTI